MNQEIAKIKVSEIYSGYNDGDSVVGYDGLLNIRPEFQREFVYTQAQQEAVIDTILKDCNLGLFTWFENDGQGSYECGDGQQRTLSVCRFISGRFPIVWEGKPMFFFNLSKELQDKIMGYEVYVVIVSGTSSEKLEWFKRINTAGAVLTQQELRNASYTGPWLSSAKDYFSRPNCPAYIIGAKYISGVLGRQDFLERALDWISGGKIENYMALHQKDKSAEDLYAEFEKIIKWVKLIFPVYRKELKGLDFGRLYREYHDNTYSTEDLEKEIQILMSDDDVTKKSGVFEYLLSGKSKEKCLSLRAFSESQKRNAYEKQKGICPVCGKHFELSEMEGDHITPWSKGGKTTPDNLQMLCKGCNKSKSNH